MRARLSPPASSSLTHARRMDGFCNQNADQLGSLAGLSLLTVYVGGLSLLTERVLFIGTQFSLLYTSMYSPAEAATSRA